MLIFVGVYEGVAGAAEYGTDKEWDVEMVGYQSGIGDDFRIGTGRSYCTGRGGSVEPEVRGLNLNWWYQATGVGAFCPYELVDRLEEAVERGDVDVMSADSDGENFMESRKRGFLRMGSIGDNGHWKRGRLSPGCSALFASMME